MPKNDDIPPAFKDFLNTLKDIPTVDNAVADLSSNVILMYAYYEKLLDKGFSKIQAFRLTRDFHQMYWTRILFSQEQGHTHS
jgi:hypothetical protein